MAKELQKIIDEERLKMSVERIRKFHRKNIIKKKVDLAMSNAIDGLSEAGIELNGGEMNIVHFVVDAIQQELLGEKTQEE